MLTGPEQQSDDATKSLKVSQKHRVAELDSGLGELLSADKVVFEVVNRPAAELFYAAAAVEGGEVLLLIEAPTIERWLLLTQPPRREHSPAASAPGRLGGRATRPPRPPPAAGKRLAAHGGQRERSSSRVASGLVQVVLANGRPVLRRGEVLLVEGDDDRALAKPRAAEATLFWILRD